MKRIILMLALIATTFFSSFAISNTEKSVSVNKVTTLKKVVKSISFKVPKNSNSQTAIEDKISSISKVCVCFCEITDVEVQGDTLIITIECECWC
ncbi:MAG: hypothetical protein U5N85_11560 [Arcicella sp.]|nr:hypothetical protein [Arcicella sp.]